MPHFLRRAASLILATVLAALFLAVLLPPALDHFKPAGGPRPQNRPFLPFPHLQQAAAAIDVLRDAPSLDTTVLRALNGPHLRVEIAATAPPVPDRLHPAPVAGSLIRGFAGLAAGDDVRVYTDKRATPGGTDVETFPALMTWHMPDGRFLVLRDLDPQHPAMPAARMLGQPLDFWIGLMGVALAGVAFLTARLEMRPLRELAVAAAAFDGNGPGLPTESRGTPDVQRLTRAVRGMQDRVAMLLQERSFLIGAISHDLKTYLTRLRLRAEHVADPAEQSRVVADLDGMTDLIETALAFARGTTASRRRSLVDIADLVAVEAAERSFLGQEIAVRGDETTDAVVRGDPMALRRVLSNLVDNAFKFGRSRVEIVVEIQPARCRLSVEDDGSGISATERTAIFSPFYRIDSSRNSRTGGHGLGLAITRQIVEAHDGTIAVEDGRLGGARFVVTLPTTRSP